MVLACLNLLRICFSILPDDYRLNNRYRKECERQNKEAPSESNNPACLRVHVLCNKKQQPSHNRNLLRRFQSPFGLKYGFGLIKFFNNLF